MTTEEIRTWLVSKISELTGIEPQEIGFEEPFAAFGLVSRDAIALSGELENLLDCRLSPSLLYDYPSISALARRLAERTENTDPIGQSSPESRQEIDPLGDILSTLESLSNAEAEALLEESALAQRLRGEELK